MSRPFFLGPRARNKNESNVNDDTKFEVTINQQTRFWESPVINTYYLEMNRSRLACIFQFIMFKTLISSLFPHGQESLKIHYIKFDIAVPLCKMYIEYIMSKIKMRPYNSV